MPRFQQWEEERWTWRRFRQLPLGFQFLTVFGILGSTSAVTILVALFIVQP